MTALNEKIITQIKTIHDNNNINASESIAQVRLLQRTAMGSSAYIYPLDLLTSFRRPVKNDGRGRVRVRVGSGSGSGQGQGRGIH